MKAHEIEYGTKVKVVDKNVMIPPEAPPINEGDEITIFEVDGMYCSGYKDGERIYIGAMTEVSRIN